MSPLWGMLLVAGWSAIAQEPHLKEASGVVRHGAELWVVGDEQPGLLFVIPVLDGGRRWTLVPDTYRVVEWPRAAEAEDPESVEVLGDGRLVLLSERRAALFTEDGLLVQYGKTLGREDGRGLEGLAVRAGADGHSRIAVLWEGGKHAPRILVHALPAAASSRVVLEEDGTVLTLEVPERGKQTQAVRATDLVWQAKEDGRDAFLVLLQGVDSNKGKGQRRSWVQRFDDQGRAQGEPLDLADCVPEDLVGANWEGMDWFVAGRQLILVHDEPPNGAPVAVMVAVPEDWQD